MDVKTITLTGAEQCVMGLDGQNTRIINKSDSAVYASLSPDIVPEADGVIEIAANSWDGLYNTNGTLYLLGTGKVELRGTDYTINFRQPSRSADGGGDTPTAETMPYMDGITGLYTAGTWNKVTRQWDSKIEGGPTGSASPNAFVVDDTLVIENEAASVNFSVDKTPRTIYTCVKLNKHSTNNSSLRRYSGIVETLVPSLGNTEPNIYVRYSYDHGSGTPNLVFSTGKTPTVSASDSLLADADNEYIVICTVLDDNTLHCYLNGDPVKTMAYDRDVNYETTIFLNFTKFLPEAYWIDLNKSYKFLAFGDVAHSEDIVKANTEWIRKTFIE